MRDAQPVALEAMRDTMQHRGPDDTGLWWSRDRRVGLAHCRLAIIDLSPGGHQPMIAGDLSVAFNGEIYNFLDLRRELEQKGHSFHTASDTEVLLAAYREWGTACLARLNGMFAFALYDERNAKLLLARDRAGEKPLFVYHDDHRLLFASELKALVAAPGFPRQIDHDALSMYLAYGYVPGEHCIWRGAWKVRQGEAVEYDVDRGTLRRWNYWNLPEPDAQTASAEELEQELETLLADAVRRQLVAADVPVGILLSGGVDSSLVTAMAARVTPHVKTFTVSFPGHAQHDESPYARIVARAFGTEHTELAAEAASFDILPQLARQYDEPIADSAIVPTYLVSRVIRQHATVALGGDGGDELFGGYPHYSWLLRQERLRRFVPMPLRYAGSVAASYLLPPGFRARNHLIGFRGGAGESIGHINLFFDRLTRRRLLGYDSHAERYRATLARGDHSLLRRATETDFRSTMVDGYLVKVDRASMLTSLEIRAPFLDHRLIDFAFRRVPDELKATMHERKILPRRVARRILPRELDIDRKQGFTPPMASWFKEGWGERIEELLQDSIFDKRTVQALLNGQRRGLRNGDRLFALTMFELWRREYRPQL